MKSLFENACARVGDAFIWLVDTADIWPLICIGIISGSVAYAVLTECAGRAA